MIIKWLRENWKECLFEILGAALIFFTLYICLFLEGCLWNG